MRFPNGDDVIHLGLGLFCFGLLALVGYATFETIRSHGETEYCYVEMWSPGQMAPQYQLHGYRPWRTDRLIGNFPTLDEANAKASSMSCPMGKRP